MRKYALLCGSAPDGLMQKKIDEMYDSLLFHSENAWSENEIMIFPNGIDEFSLVHVLNNLRRCGIEHVLLYICTVTPVLDCEKTVWLGGNEIRKMVFEKPASLAGVVTENDFLVQVVYDSDRDFVDGSEYYLDAEVAADVLGAGR